MTIPNSFSSQTPSIKRKRKADEIEVIVNKEEECTLLNVVCVQFYITINYTSLFF